MKKILLVLVALVVAQYASAQYTLVGQNYGNVYEIKNYSTLLIDMDDVYTVRLDGADASCSTIAVEGDMEYEDNGELNFCSILENWGSYYRYMEQPCAQCTFTITGNVEDCNLVIRANIKKIPFVLYNEDTDERLDYVAPGMPFYFRASERNYYCFLDPTENTWGLENSANDDGYENEALGQSVYSYLNPHDGFFRMEIAEDNGDYYASLTTLGGAFILRNIYNDTETVLYDGTTTFVTLDESSEYSLAQYDSDGNIVNYLGFEEGEMYDVGDSKCFFYGRAVGLTQFYVTIDCSEEFDAPISISETDPNAHECSDYLTEVAQVDATCTTSGRQAHYVCSKCGNLYADIDADTPIDAVEEFEIPALGHDYAEWEDITGGSKCACGRNCGSAFYDFDQVANANMLCVLLDEGMCGKYILHLPINSKVTRTIDNYDFAFTLAGDTVHFSALPSNVKQIYAENAHLGDEMIQDAESKAYISYCRVCSVPVQRAIWIKGGWCTTVDENGEDTTEGPLRIDILSFNGEESMECEVEHFGVLNASVSLGAKNYSNWTSVVLPFDLTVQDDMEYATFVSIGKHRAKFHHLSEGDVIPASTPFIFRSKESYDFNDRDFTATNVEFYTRARTTATAPYIFRGTYQPCNLTDSIGYVVNNGELHAISKLAEKDKEVVVKKLHAYIVGPEELDGYRICLDDEGIDINIDDLEDIAGIIIGTVAVEDNTLYDANEDGKITISDINTLVENNNLNDTTYGNEDDPEIDEDENVYWAQ